MDGLEESLRKEFIKSAKDLCLDVNKTIKFECNSQFGFFLRVSRKEERCLRGNERSYKTIDANKAGVRFRSLAMERMNEKYLELKEEFHEQQKNVVAEVVAIATGYSEPLQQLSGTISLIDVFVSIATACLDAPKPYVRPTFVNDPKRRLLSLKGVRHACLERQEGISFISNDLHMDSEDKTLQIITGPNMGGKSTFIRSIGMVVLMAQMGCMVPCDEACLSLIDGLYARVGAGDDQTNGISTFMAEMLETSSILKSASEKSLLLIDELGRGTSTYDGLGLAHGIAKHICTELKSFCLFATHFHELTSMTSQLPSVGNLRTTALTTPDSLTLLYRVEPGICDQSFGIKVAEMVKFPRRIIKNAKHLVSGMERCAALMIADCRKEEEEPNGVGEKNRSRDNDGGDVDDDDDDSEKAAQNKRPKMDLESIRQFLKQVESVSEECNDGLAIWEKMQELKRSLRCD